MVHLISLTVLDIYPAVSNYGLSKLAVARLGEHIAAEHPNIRSVSLDPNLADTDMLLAVYKEFDKASFELIGAGAVWLCSGEAGFLNGRYFMVSWDVDELMAKKDQIVGGNELTFRLRARLGKDQFEK